MARAVVRQKNIPYALIIFVILFVIASGLAVFFYMHDDGKAMNIVALKEDKAELDAEIEALQEQVEGLAQYVSGSGSHTMARDAYEAFLTGDDADDAIPKVDPNIGLVENLREFQKQIIDQIGRADRAETKLDDLEAALTEQIENERDRRIAMESVVSDRNDEVAQVKLEQQTERAEHARQLSETRQRFDEIRNGLSREIVSLTGDLANVRKHARELEDENERLTLRVADLLQLDLAENVAMYPDGEITRVVDERTCYISLGSGNGVIPDLIFSVYSPSGDADGAKAMIVVKQVFEDASECLITKLEDPRDPVAPGDIIGNIAFDENRVYTFLVSGRFDMRGGNQPTDEGREQIIAMIREFGGQVVGEVDVDVDFVVLGPQPILPPEPDDDTPPTVRQIYETRQTEIAEYDEVKRQAIALGLRILNTNRFLERLGYVPVRTLTYEEDY